MQSPFPISLREVIPEKGDRKGEEGESRLSRKGLRRGNRQTYLNMDAVDWLLTAKSGSLAQRSA
jgi:hypothetical protein